MTTLKQINEFFESQPIAIVGVSRNPKKFGHTVFKELREKGLKLVPVNPNTDEILGEKTYPTVTALPSEVKGVMVLTKRGTTAGVIREAKQRGIKQIWIQQMAESPEAIKELKDSDINYITGECVFMYFKPNGVHKFHGAIKKFFGRFPK